MEPPARPRSPHDADSHGAHRPAVLARARREDQVCLHQQAEGGKDRVAKPDHRIFAERFGDEEVALMQTVEGSKEEGRGKEGGEVDRGR